MISDNDLSSTPCLSFTADAAFAKLPPGLVDALMKDLPLLTQILTYHVVSGKVPASEVVKMDGADVATVNGKTAKVSIEGNTVKIGSATVVQTDVAADNGVIHVIDSVILPPGITLPTPAPAASGKKAAKATASIDVKKEPGITAPFGFFDPAGLCPDDPVLYKRYRESEIKHGRVAMLAFLGILIGESGFSLIGIDGPAIYQYQQAEGILNAWSWNVIGLTLAVEGYSIVNAWQPADETFRDTTALAGLKDDYTPGDLKWDPLNFAPADAEAYKTVQTKELNNGRLAMLAVAGIVAQELVTGQSIF
jgi:hypothetical protein